MGNDFSRSRIQAGKNLAINLDQNKVISVSGREAEQIRRFFRELMYPSQATNDRRFFRGHKVLFTSIVFFDIGFDITFIRFVVIIV